MPERDEKMRKLDRQFLAAVTLFLDRDGNLFLFGFDARPGRDGLHSQFSEE
jgi:hypothetical protein